MNLEGKYIKINSHHKMIVDELRKNGNKIYIDEMTYDYWGDSTILIYYKKIYNRLDWMFDGGEWSLIEQGLEKINVNIVLRESKLKRIFDESKR